MHLKLIKGCLVLGLEFLQFVFRLLQPLLQGQTVKRGAQADDLGAIFEVQRRKRPLHSVWSGPHCANHRISLSDDHLIQVCAYYPTRFHTPTASSRAFAMIAASSRVVSWRSFISTLPLAMVWVTCAPSTPKRTCQGRLPVVSGVGGA